MIWAGMTAAPFRRMCCAACLAATITLDAAAPVRGQPPPPAENGAEQMKIRDLYPLITTPLLAETRDFYVRHFGFQVGFEASWFLYLIGPGEEGARGAVLAFMHPDHPSDPPGPERFDGRGMILTVEVGDAAAAFRRLGDGGAPILYPLTDEAWGQRRFMTRDPAGVMVDVVEQIAPAAGFWEPYMIRN